MHSPRGAGERQRAASEGLIVPMVEKRWTLSPADRHSRERVDAA